jgi:hypothetical protein
VVTPPGDLPAVGVVAKKASAVELDSTQKVSPMKTQKSVEGSASGPSNKKVVKLVLGRETVRALGVRTGVKTAGSVVSICSSHDTISVINWMPTE